MDGLWKLDKIVNVIEAAAHEKRTKTPTTRRW
jgi:hypothetical protein